MPILMIVALCGLGFAGVLLLIYCVVESGSRWDDARESSNGRPEDPLL